MDYLLRGMSFSFENLKGGTGKSTLLANMASISHKKGWTTVIVDLDSNLALTLASLGDDTNHTNTLIQAIERIQMGMSFEDLLCWSQALSCYILQGSVNGIDENEAKLIPEVINQLKNTVVINDGVPVPVDLVLVDLPGENVSVNTIAMSALDYIAVPFMFSITDCNAVLKTYETIKRVQNSNVAKNPKLLGLLPNNVDSKGSVERSLYDFVKVIAESSRVLPYIPHSRDIKGTMLKQTKDGKKGVVDFAQNRPIALRLESVWDSLNDPEKKDYSEEFARFINLDTSSTAEETNG